MLLSLVVIAGLSIGVNRLEATSSKTCLDPECVELGAQVLASLDETFDPCVDFYKFACNKALEQTIIPFGESWREQRFMITYILTSGLVI